jgi:DNA polymerase
LNAPFQRTAISLAVTPTRLWLDLETFSETPIRDGTHRYAENAEILLFAYAMDDGGVSVWDVTEGEAMPDDLRHALLNAPEVWAHNSGFDRTVLRNVMPDLCPPIERWRDTMVQALAHSLPGALGVLSEVLGLNSDDAKDKRGKQLVRLFCIPRKFAHQYISSEFATKAEFKAAVAKAKANWCGRATKQTHPREWAEFIQYAASDIKAMRVIERKLPNWNFVGTELGMWHLDQHINDRGVMTDTALAAAAVKAVEREQKILAARTVDLTLGQVSSTNKRQQLIDHLLEHFGVALDDLKGSTIEKRLEHADLDPVVRELLLVRMQASTTSTSKYKALLKGVSRDGRLRGLLQFCGAGRTGRWAGRLFQPQNMSRGVLHGRLLDEAVDALLLDVLDLL